MYVRVSHQLILTTLLMFTPGVCAQTQPATPDKPHNASQLSIQSITPNSGGVAVNLTALEVQVLGASLEKQNQNTGNWMPVVVSIYVPVPGELFGTHEYTSGTVLFPILVQPDPSVIYRLSMFARSKDDSGMDWINAVPMTFKGYSATVSPTFKVDFTNDALKISADTSDIATLTAAWQFSGQIPVSVQQSTESQNPQVSLSFAALEEKSGSIPSLVLTLVDKKTNQRQEARLTLGVASTKAVSQKVQLAAASDNPSKQNISWADLLKTGISALLKYFTKV